jgi:hypothetical protein
MRLPGLTAESSLYRSTGRYHVTWSGGSNAPVSASITMVNRSQGVRPVPNSSAIPAAQQACPPSCVATCEHGCRADGLSPGSCATLCERDCSAYSSGQTVSCGPCVNNSQTCTLCGGATVTRGCGLVSCGSGACPFNFQCCDGTTCCPQDAQCCGDGHGCCAAGQECASFLGAYFCIPSFLSGLS